MTFWVEDWNGTRHYCGNRLANVGIVVACDLYPYFQGYSPKSKEAPYPGFVVGKNTVTLKDGTRASFKVYRSKD